MYKKVLISRRYKRLLKLKNKKITQMKSKQQILTFGMVSKNRYRWQISTRQDVQSASLPVTEMQIETTINYIYTPITMD